MDGMETAKDLLKFIEESPSAFHVVAAGKRRLKAAGFTELPLQAPWKIKAGGRYYAAPYDAMLLAFRVGRRMERGLRVAAAHTDFPCFQLKPLSSMAENGYGKLNVEPYGGMILNTWLDRPLSLAGKVALRGSSSFAPQVRLVDLKRPLLTIPNLAIHMNREVNKGTALNRQKDMLPLAKMLAPEAAKEDFLGDLLAAELDCDKQAILSNELMLYPVETGCLVGFSEEFISSPRLDNLTSVKACLDGIVAGQRTEGLDVIALFDHEEVGSRTKQGAGSLLLTHFIERIYAAAGFGREAYLAALTDGFMLSVDVAHALHPNAPEKSDPTHQPILNGGVVLKTAASQSYAGDCEAVGIAVELARRAGIASQYFVNRSDSAGGSTLGSIASTLLPLRTMDIGVPILAMHSVRETMGANDQLALQKMLQAFFS